LLAYLTKRDPFQSRLRALAPGEAGRIERVLAAARAFLAVSSLAAIWFDPTEPSRYASLAYALMLAYVLYSLFVLAWVRFRHEFGARFVMGVHAIDVLWPAAIILFTSPTSSPFFVFNAFVLLEAAYRWGFQETLATAGAEVLLYFCISVLPEIVPAMGVFLSKDVEVNRLILRPLYLAMMAYLLGYLGEQEKLQRAEATGMARLVGSIQGEIGLRGALRAVFEETLKIFGCVRTTLIVGEKTTGRAIVWNGTRESNGRRMDVRWSEPDPPVGSEALSGAPGAVWLVGVGAPDESPAPNSVSALGAEGSTLRKVSWSPSEELMRCLPPFQRALVAASEFGGEWSGWWWLLDPDLGPRPQAAAVFLRALAGQLGPAVHAVFAAQKLRSQAGAMERAHMARELHDGVIQSLIGMEMQVDVLRRKSPPADHHLAGELAALQSNLHEEVLNLRELMQQMKPVDLGPRQFLEYLAAAVDRFSRDTGIAARFITSVGNVRLGTRVANEVAHIVQEALVNVRRHSGADNVVVRLDAENGFWVLTIDDDGCGFDFSGSLSQAQLDSARKGPVIIKERVRSIRGELAVESLPGQGSRLVIRFPQKY
jgi:signal transduction histidine kinase